MIWHSSSLLLLPWRPLRSLYLLFYIFIILMLYKSWLRKIQSASWLLGTCKVDGDIFSPQILNWWSLLRYFCQSVETYWNIRVTNILKCGQQYYSRLSAFFEWAIQVDWCVWEWNVHNWSCGVRKIKELWLLPIPYSIVCFILEYFLSYQF